MSAPARAPGRIGRRPIWYALASVVFLVPCYWQSRIQAGDLSSHLYNAWLAGGIESGHLQGLQIASQTTNVLFDVLLSGLLRTFGAAWAQRLSVSLCVLVFVWGAFSFVSVAAGRLAWQLLPCIAMLAYGWTFHMGFFNFYLSLGLCFWSLALFWTPSPARLTVTVILLAVAYAAHALPVLWALALMVYAGVARRLPENLRARLAILALLLLVSFHFLVQWRFVSHWTATQITSAPGGDQIMVFDGKYGYLAAVLMFWWVSCSTALWSRGGRRELARSILLHWWLLTAAGILAIPTLILIPGFRHALVYIAERMSLASGICFCALIGGTKLRPVQRYAPLALCILFFAFLFRDEGKLNRFEDRIDQVVAQLPYGQRVVSSIVDSDLRASAETHMIDRACVDHCYSYANYEPSTAAFRIRATKPNPYVIFDYTDSFDMQNGMYVFKERDLPVYALEISRSGQIETRSLPAGVASGTSELHLLR